MAAASIRSFDAKLKALVEKVSKLNGLSISVIGNSLKISMEIRINAKIKFFFNSGIWILLKF